MAERERVRRAIEAAVENADKLLAELDEAGMEERLRVVVDGWGRGLAAGLEELAVAIGDLREGRDAPDSPPAEDVSEPARPEPETTDERDGNDLSDVAEGRLRVEAERSREAIAAQREEAEEARRELEGS